MSVIVGSESAPGASSLSNGGVSHAATATPLPLNERPHYKVAPRVGWSVRRLRYWMRDHKLSVKTASESDIIEALRKSGHTIRDDVPQAPAVARPAESSRPAQAIRPAQPTRPPQPTRTQVHAASARATIKALECLESIEMEVLTRLAKRKRALPLEVKVLQALLYLRDEDR